MIHIDFQIEEHLNQTAARWRLQRFLKHSSLLGSALTALVLALGAMMVAGWVTNSRLVIAGFVVIVLAGGFVWLLLGILCAGATVHRDQISRSLESSNPQLMDRVNTLVYLEGRRDRHSSVFADSIQKQTHHVFRTHTADYPFSRRRALVHFSILGILAAITVLFYARFHPWQRMQAAEQALAAASQAQELFLESPTDEELVSAPSAQARQAAWGEIRISEPGRDLRSTKLDVVALQIEAAANQPIVKVEWHTSVNQQTPVPHSLPPPEDPRYVVYRPELDLEEFGVQEWDVLSYYALATCAEGSTYKSDVYFIGIFPFREELDSIPGGSEGPAYRLLEQLTGMVERQQEVIRQTDRQDQLKDQPTVDRKKKFQALAHEETDLARTSRHLAAHALDQFDQQAITGLSDHLDLSASSFRDADRTLRDDDAAAAKKHENSAFRGLIATRKRFQEILRENPGAFQLRADQIAQEDPIEMLKKDRRARDQTQRVREQLEDLIERQQQIQRQASSRNPETLNKLAIDQRRIQDQLERLVKEYPDAFRSLAEDDPKAAHLLDQPYEWSERLNNEWNDPRQFELRRRLAERSVRRFKRLAESMQQTLEALKIDETNNLRRMLEDNIEDYGQIEQKPAAASQERLDQATDRTKDILDRLDRLAAEQSGTHPQPELNRLLSEGSATRLQKASDGLPKQKSDADKKKSAGTIKQDLERLAQGLDRDLTQKQRELENSRIAQELKLMQESQSELQRARDFVQRSLTEQRNLERSAGTRNQKEFPNIAARQERLLEQFEDFLEQHPDTFRDTAAESNGVRHAMRRSTRSLKSRSADAQQQLGQAANNLQDLDDALKQLQQVEQLADAHKLRKMLDQQINELQQLEANPSRARSRQCRQAAQRSRELAERLKQIADGDASRDGFGDSLRESLSDARMKQMNAQADRLAQADETSERRQAAGRLRTSLQQLAKAFDDSLPEMLAGRRRADSLHDSGQQALSRGVRSLESAARRRTGSATDSQRAQSRLRQEAMRCLSDGISDLGYGNSDRARDLIQQLRENLEEPDFHLDMQVVQDLIRELQALNSEVVRQSGKSAQETGERVHIDPAKLPPEYGKAIEKYFERLSEQ